MASRWESVDTSVSDPPACPAVYVFFMNGRPFYVGSTSNLRSRIISHIKPRTEWWGHEPAISERMLDMRNCQQIRFKRSLRYGDWLMWEARLIKRLQPVGNKRGTSRRKSELQRFVANGRW